MKIEEDVRQIAESLLDRTSNKEIVETVIYSSSYPNRHPQSLTYTYSESIEQMKKIGLIKIVTIEDEGIPVGENSTLIHYYSNYKIQYSPIALAEFLKDRIKYKSLKENKFKILTDIIPYCEAVNGVGYLKFYKEGKKVEIGSITSEHYKFLNHMLSHINAYIDVKEVYEVARNKKDKVVAGYERETLMMINIIKTSWIKELQKDKKMRSALGQIKFNFKDRHVQIEFVPSSSK